MILKLPLCLATLLFAGVTAVAQDPKPAPAPHPTPVEQGKPAEKKATFAVVAVGEDLKVMNENAVEALKKDKQAAYDKALAAHNKAKKDAEDAKKPFTEKPPVHEMVEVKKGGFATEALAKEHLDSLMKAKKDAEKPKEKKEEKHEKKDEKHETHGKK